MTAHDVEVALVELLNDCAERNDYELTDDATATSFKEAGVMQSEDGLILRRGGDEFQITIVQSRRAPRPQSRLNALLAPTGECPWGGEEPSPESQEGR